MLIQPNRANHLRQLSPLPPARQQPPAPPSQDSLELQSEPSHGGGWRIGGLALLGLAGAAALTGCTQSPPQAPQAQEQQVPTQANLGQVSGQTREQVLSQLLRMEGSQSDAVGDFNTIAGNLKPGEDFAQAAESFYSLLHSYGSSATVQVRSTYVQIGNGLRAKESRSSNTEMMLRLYRSEGSQTDASSDYEVVQKSLRDGEDRSAATDAFLRIYQAVGNTSYAQTHYNLVNNTLRPQESRSSAVDTLLQLQRAEGSSSDTDSDYQLIDGKISDSRSRADATAQFLRLYHQTGNTQRAQEMFRTLNP